MKLLYILLKTAIIILDVALSPLICLVNFRDNTINKTNIEKVEETQKEPKFSEYQYNAFISYSRQNIAFASKLENTLERYNLPKDLRVLQRHLNIFLDKRDFTTGDYYQKLDANLGSSESLIVICSPEARRSKYVNDEIRRFVQKRGSSRIIPILLSGIPNNEVKPDQETEMAFPEALCEVLEMPLAANYLSFNSRKDKVNKGIFSESWYSVLAEIQGVSRGKIEQREEKAVPRQEN